MSYSSKNGRRPNEYASKSSHTYIIQDPEVNDFLDRCDLPKSAGEIDIPKDLQHKIDDVEINPIKHIVAVDGGYTEVSVKKEFPSATLTFFQFGALVFSIEDLQQISEKHFIDPEDMAKLNNVQRIKLTLPTKNILLKNDTSFIKSFRTSIFEFFKQKSNEQSFIKTLQWLVFKEFLPTPDTEYKLASCPSCKTPDIMLKHSAISTDHKIQCPKCNEDIYLTDVFRLHEAVDNELGAAGVSGYLTISIEQIIMADLIRTIINTKPAILNEILIIKDGPLAFFGQTANMHKLFRELYNFISQGGNLFLVGLEKSGPFVEHAIEIAEKLKPNSVLLLSNDYIYQNIIPGKADPSNPYARSSYYSSKVIFKSKAEKVYVATLPTSGPEIVLNPKKSDFKNIDIIMNNLELLRCDMYDNSLFPVALANKLVSLADHPSSQILEKFAKKSIYK
jgi:hypothetical protein